MNPATPMIYYRSVWRSRVRVAPEIVLSDEEREVLDDLTRSKLTSVRLDLRARIVLLAAQGLQNKEIALALDVGRIQASRWRERYLESLEDDNFSILDLESLVLTGRIIEHQRDAKTREAKVVIAGVTLEGGAAEAVVKVGASGRLVVITVYLD